MIIVEGYFSFEKSNQVKVSNTRTLQDLAAQSVECFCFFLPSGVGPALQLWIHIFMD